MNAFAKSNNTDAIPSNPSDSSLVLNAGPAPKYLVLKLFPVATFALHLIALSSLALWILSDNPAPMSLALQFTLIATAALIAWGAATFLMLCTYLATSISSFNGILSASFQAAIPSVWLVPAYLLLSTSNLAPAAIGLLLAANATRLLIARRMSNRRIRITRPVKQEEMLFHPPSGSNQGILPLLFGSLILEISLGSILTGHVIAALLLACSTVALWTWSSIASDAYRPRTAPANWPHAVWSVLIALFILTSFPQLGKGLGIADESTLANLMSPGVELDAIIPKDLAETTKKLAIPSKKGIPGVILRPKGMAPQRMIVVPVPARARLFRGQALRFSFTGEYHLFPWSSKRGLFDSGVIEGTPLDAAYGTLDSGSMVTEALQELNPPLNFADCAKIQVDLVSNDGSVGLAGMQLLAPGAIRDLGTDLFGLAQKGKEETIEFAVPASAHGFLAHAIRLTFDRPPKERHISSRIAIRSFVLLPVDRKQ